MLTSPDACKQQHQHVQCVGRRTRMCCCWCSAAGEHAHGRASHAGDGGMRGVRMQMREQSCVLTHLGCLHCALDLAARPPCAGAHCCSAGAGGDRAAQLAAGTCR